MTRATLNPIPTQVHGIPCAVVVDFYQPPEPAYIGKFPGAGFGDAEPGANADIEWHVVDRKGYDAPWLEAKLTEQEQRAITHWLLEEQ